MIPQTDHYDTPPKAQKPPRKPLGKPLGKSPILAVSVYGLLVLGFCYSLQGYANNHSDSIPKKITAAQERKFSAHVGILRTPINSASPQTLQNLLRNLPVNLETLIAQRPYASLEELQKKNNLDGQTTQKLKVLLRF
jgi:hypothetical protein